MNQRIFSTAALCWLLASPPSLAAQVANAHARSTDFRQRIESAVEADDPGSLRAELQALDQALAREAEDEFALSLLPALAVAWRSGEVTLEALPLLERAIEALSPSAAETRRVDTVAMLLKAAARARYAYADPDRAGEHLRELREIYRRQSTTDRSLQREYRWSGRLAAVAREHLRGNQLAEAFELLGAAADLELPWHHAYDAGLAGAAGGLHRRLAELNVDERYALLRAWTMPVESRRTVRVLTTVVPTERPPAVFARALGERPHRTSFPVAEVGEIDGLFCTTWALIHAAAETGRLPQLTADLAEHAEQGIPNAAFARTLAKLASSDAGEDAALRAEIERRAVTLSSGEPQSEGGLQFKVALAAASLGHESLRPLGERMLETLAEQNAPRDSRLIRPFLRRAFAQAVGGQSSHALDDPGPLWIPASRSNFQRHAQGAVSDIWLTQESHILHLAGPHDDALCFRYPLTGDFEFSCEALDGGAGDAEGGLLYGGLAFQPSAARHSLRVSGAGLPNDVVVPNYFVANSQRAFFARYLLRAESNEVSFAVNGHPLWSGPANVGASPWMGLACRGDQRPIFRRLEIRGEPEIPREVHLSGGDVLSGWDPAYYEPERRTPLPISKPDSELAWFSRDGIVHGNRQTETGFAAAQSRLAYFRPLQPGETVGYEFQYEPGRYAVHLALGRLALLIEPSGVRLHWMTDGDAEWTGLPADNAVIEPLNRRGPRPLPLRTGWNQVDFELTGDKLVLSLNETTIYERPVAAGDDTTFSLYHDRDRTEARARHVVLRGDWPERLSSTQLGKLAATSESKRTAADRALVATLFGERHVVDAALPVHRRAVGLPPEQRYQYLVDWVLPGDGRLAIRPALDFTPTNPALPVADPADLRQMERRAAAGRARVSVGGNLVAPAIDLAEVARELGRLDELLARIERFTPQNEWQKRSQLALRTIVLTAMENFAEALAAFDRLIALVEAGDHLNFVPRWPETLAIWYCARYPETREAARDVLYVIHFRQARTSARGNSQAWIRHVNAMIGRLKYLDLNPEDARAAGFHRAPDLSRWIPASRATARSRGRGYPRSHWELRPGRVDLLSSHDKDYLYYQLPLRGNYEVECEVTPFGWRDSSLSVAGEWVAPIFNLVSYGRGDLRRELPRGSIEPRLTDVKDWIRYRTVVRDGVCTTYFNGRKIHSRRLPDEHEPWLAVHSHPFYNGGARGLRITGKPRIPEKISLSAQTDLPGWVAYFDEESVGETYSDWRQLSGLQSGSEIVGAANARPAGAMQESLLYYHRPMLEDGAIEYEFYYEPGAIHTHPALGRLAFLLEPDGVRLHWITDGPYDRTGLDPGNTIDEPANRLGPDKLPLDADAWNRMRLELTGDVVQLSVNGRLVYERSIEPVNQRNFGLFHFADQTEARVRDVVWHGGWPRELPPVEEQELAGEGADFLDEALPRLTKVFEHDFSRGGLPPDRFVITGPGWPDHVTVQPDGVHVTRPGSTGFRDYVISPQLTVHGDFDIQAAFADFQPDPSPGGNGSVLVHIVLDDEHPTEAKMCRRFLRHTGRHDQQIVQAIYDGESREWLGNVPEESTSGTLRIARRGETVYWLYAENDSQYFRLLASRRLGDADLRANGGVRLVTQCAQPGSTSVVWKRVLIRAEDITGLPPDDPQQVVRELDAERNKLPARFVHDFQGRGEVSQELFHRWGLREPLRSEADGLRIIAPGADNWTSVGLDPRLGMQGDFDVEIAFDEVEFGKPDVGKNSALYLQIGLADPGQSQLNLIFLEKPKVGRAVYAQNSIRNDEGQRSYDRLRLDIPQAVDRLRLARRGERLYYIYRNKNTLTYHVAAEDDLPAAPVPLGNVRLLLHTGAAGEESTVLLKQFRVYADRFVPPPL